MNNKTNQTLNKNSMNNIEKKNTYMKIKMISCWCWKNEYIEQKKQIRTMQNNGIEKIIKLQKLNLKEFQW